MSSLAAARADNFYHPPDWDPRRQSRAEASGAVGWKAHPLRERAKKLASEGVLVIRFEMPFDVRCSHCGNRIAKGVRFDAEKKCVGKYLSTKIWSFRMLCAAEDGTTRTARQLSGAHHIEVRTDPQSGDYVVVSGAQKVEQTARSAAELGVETLLDPDEQKRLEADPFYKLERDAPRAAQRKARQPWQAALQQKQDGLWADDYAMSQALRRAHRGSRAAAAADAAANAAKGIRVPLVAERPDETSRRRAPSLAPRSASAPTRRAARRLRLLGGSALGGALAPAAAAAGAPPTGQLRRSRGMRITAERHKHGGGGGGGARASAAAACGAGGAGVPHRPQEAGRGAGRGAGNAGSWTRRLLGRLGWLTSTRNLEYTSRITKRYGANSGGSSFGASATAFAGPYDHAGAPAAPQPTSPSPSTWR